MLNTMIDQPTNLDCAVLKYGRSRGAEISDKNGQIIALFQCNRVALPQSKTGVSNGGETAIPCVERHLTH